MRKFITTERGILIVVLLLAAILRFWSLGSVPPSASLDEASIGYNAYSILKTGGDEYGELPFLSHRAYDDYRRATYLYLVIPFVKILGLNVLAVRLPAVILSVLTVLATFFLVKTLFHLRGVHSATSEVLALLTAFLLAISPWHIYISRLGHESNAYLSFFVFGVLFFLRGQRKESWVWVLLSMFFFTLSMVSYYAGQVFIPLFVLGLFFLFRRKLLSLVLSEKKIIIIFFLFLILLIPIFKGIFSNESLIRFQGTNIFNSQPERTFKYAIKRVEAIGKDNFFEVLIYDRRVLMVRQFLEEYVVHFKPEWLFTNLSGEPHKVPNMGLLYLWGIPFIIIGVVTLLFSHLFDTKVKLLILLWFFLSPLPAALATQAPHAMRSYTFLPVWQIFTAIGLAYTMHKLQKFKILVLFAFMFFILANLVTFYRNYFIVFPKEQSDSFQYALSKAIPYVLSKQENYDKIIFSNKDNLYQSYMLFLFHSGYSPILYQQQGGTKSGGFAETHKFGQFEFKPIVWDREQEKNALYVGNIDEFPPDVTVEATFSHLDEKNAIKVVERE